MPSYLTNYGLHMFEVWQGLPFPHLSLQPQKTLNSGYKYMVSRNRQMPMMMMKCNERSVGFVTGFLPCIYLLTWLILFCYLLRILSDHVMCYYVCGYYIEIFDVTIQFHSFGCPIVSHYLSAVVQFRSLHYLMLRIWKYIKFQIARLAQSFTLRCPRLCHFLLFTILILSLILSRVAFRCIENDVNISTLIIFFTNANVDWAF